MPAKLVKIRSFAEMKELASDTKLSGYVVIYIKEAISMVSETKDEMSVILRFMILG
jgi:hypothetical protein